MDPAHAADLTKRFTNRTNSFNALDDELKAMQANGQIVLEPSGLIRNADTGRPYTGDHDMFRITDAVTGQDLPPNSPLYNKVVNDMKKPPFDAQHGAHMQWQYDPKDPAHGSLYQMTDQKIRNEHTAAADGGGDQPLISLGPGQVPSATFFHGPVNPWATPTPAPGGGG
jgi:hypothetical protein